MRHLILLSFIGLLLVGCRRPLPQPSYDSDSVIRIINFHAVFLEQKYRLNLVRSSIGYDAILRRAHLEYGSQDLVDLWQARELLVTTVESLLVQLNNHPALWEQMSEHPLTADDLDISIVFESDFGKYIDPLYVGSLRLCRGVVTFYAYNITDVDADVWHLETEEYDRTRLFVETRKMALPYYAPEKPGKTTSILNSEKSRKL